MLGGQGREFLQKIMQQWWDIIRNERFNRQSADSQKKIGMRLAAEWNQKNEKGSQTRVFQEWRGTIQKEKLRRLQEQAAQLRQDQQDQKLEGLKNSLGRQGNQLLLQVMILVLARHPSSSLKVSYLSPVIQVRACHPSSSLSSEIGKDRYLRISLYLRMTLYL